MNAPGDGRRANRFLSSSARRDLASYHLGLPRSDRGLPDGSSLARLWPVSAGLATIWAYRRSKFRKSFAGLIPTTPATAPGRNANPDPFPKPRARRGYACWSQLSKGRRRLPGGESSACLLGRGGANCYRRPSADRGPDSYVGRRPSRTNGRLAQRTVGPIPEAPWEGWRRNVDAALRKGVRGLPGGSSLAQLLRQRRRTGSGSPAQLATSLP